MPHFELVMPKMGESIIEATILRWVKGVGESVDVDDTILEIATDKVDTDVPSPVKGILAEIRFKANDVVPVGQIIALIATTTENLVDDGLSVSDLPAKSQGTTPIPSKEVPKPEGGKSPTLAASSNKGSGKPGRFFSPLVRTMAAREKVSAAELDAIAGTGMMGRVTKADLLGFLDARGQKPTFQPPGKIMTSGHDEIIEMDRMRKLIADHMVMSRRTSAHVTSFAEADVTEIVRWREKVKDSFAAKYQQKITYTPVFIQAVARALRDFPLVNVSVDENRIIVRKDIHIGMATALPTGNLIVPVVRHADQLSLPGLTDRVNDLAERARANQLSPDEVQGGTFTLTNVGIFGSIMGTPIINQPQVAILAVGAIKKKPAVVETPYGDLIAVRHLMFLSLSYDHRVVDGALGSSFLRRIADYLERFDASQET